MLAEWWKTRRVDKYSDAILRGEVRDVNAPCAFTQGQTLLHIVAAEAVTQPERMFHLEKLCKHPGIDVNVADREGRTPLHVVLQASGASVHVVVKCLLTAGADANARDQKGNTPSTLAIHNCQVGVDTMLGLFHAGAKNIIAVMLSSNMRHATVAAVIDALIETPLFDVNCVVCLQSRGRLLHVALREPWASRFKVAWVKRLCLSRKADANVTDCGGRTPLHTALLAGGSETKYMLSCLLAAGASINAKDVGGETPMHLAAKTDDAQHLAALLSHGGADVNASSVTGQTPLHTAFISLGDQAHVSGNVVEKIAELLLTAGASVNMTDKKGDTPTKLAVRNSKVGVFTMIKLFNAGANSIIELLLSSGKRHTIIAEVISILIENPLLDVNCAVRRESRETLLHMALKEAWASPYKAAWVQRLCLHRKADANAADCCGYTPLHAALLAGGEQVKPMLSCLLTAGASTNAKDARGETPVHLSAKMEDAQCLTALISHGGADVNALNAAGQTPLHTALGWPWKRAHAMVPLLLRARAHVNGKDTAGESPLHSAARTSTRALLLALVEASADVNAENQQGRTAVEVVLDKPELMEALVCPALDVNRVVVASKQQTLLHVVLEASWALEQRAPLVDKLCSNPACDVNLADQNGDVALHLALKLHGDEFIVETLLKAAADVNLQNKHGLTPLLAAVRSSPVQLRKFQTWSLALLLHAGADGIIDYLLQRQQILPAVDLLIRDTALDVNRVVVRQRRETLLHVVAGAAWAASCRACLVAQLCGRAELDVNLRDSNGRTPLHVAAGLGDGQASEDADSSSEQLRMVCLMLDARADVDAVDGLLHTPLHMAARASAWPSLKRLVEASCDVNVADVYGSTPLELLLDTPQPCPLAVSALIRTTLDVNCKVTSEGGTVLHVALQAYYSNWSSSQRASLVRRICDHPAIDTNIADCSGQTALHAMLGDHQIDEDMPADEVHDLTLKLLFTGSDLSVEDANGDTPVCLAVRNPALEVRVFSLLLDYGAADLVQLLLQERRRPVLPVIVELIDHPMLDVNRRVRQASQETLLHVVLRDDWAAPERARLAAALCGRGKQAANAGDWKGRTPLHAVLEQGASDRGHLPAQYNIISALLEAGADVNAEDADRVTPLHLELQQRAHAGMVWCLLQSKASVNVADVQGRTAMHTVLKVGSDHTPKLVDLLLKSSGDVSAKDVDGETPAHVAAGVLGKNGLWSCLQKLVDAGASINAADKRGRAVLHAALGAGAPGDAVKGLLSMRADVNHKDSSGEAPLHLAVSRSAWHAVEPLVGAGSDLNAEDASGRTPVQLLLSLREPRPSALKELIHPGLDVNRVLDADTQKTLLHVLMSAAWAASHRTSLVLALCAHPTIDTNVADCRGQTALHLALLRDGGEAHDLVSALLKGRADVNAQDKDRKSPVYTAVRRTAVEPRTLASLMAGGARDLIERLLLQRTRPILPVVEGLLEDPALPVNDVVVKDQGRTLLHVVLCADWAAPQRPRLVQQLCARPDVNVNVADRSGQTPLHLVFESDECCVQTDLIDALLKGQGDVNVKNRSGKTAVDAAASNPCVKMPTLLMLQQFADPDGQQTLAAAVAARFEQLEARHRRLEGEHAELRQEQQRLDAQLRREQASCRNLTDTRDRLKEKDRQSQRQIRDLQGEGRRMQENNGRLQREVDGLQQEKWQLHTTNGQQQRQIERLQEESRQLQAQRESSITFDVPAHKFEVMHVKPSAQLFFNRREHFFREAESQFLRQLQPGSTLKIRAVDIIFNGRVWQRYRRRRRGENCRERWGFHGTDEASLQQIIRNGFEVGGQGVPIRNGAARGNGVYLANSPELSVGFAHNTQKMLMVQFYEHSGSQDRDAWVVASKEDVCPRYVLHF